MNKKLQKGLTTAMAVAIGAGIVVPTLSVIAAPAVLTTGWVKTGSTWNYLKSGVKQAGWIKDNGTWYFLNTSGAMQTGWVKDRGTWYFLNASGAMKTGWVQSGSTWYYLNAGGDMASSKWIQSGASYYYVNTGGDMAVNTTTPDGYKVDMNGVWIKAAVVIVTPTPDANLTVSSVSAISSNSLKVSFNSAVADTSKVVFTTTQSTTSVDVIATWSADNTVATLTKSAKFTAGTYTVAVKNGTADLGTSNVTVTDQKINKINITSNKLGVVTNSATAVQTGYVTYTVLDQYGNDITTSSLANSLTFQSGVASSVIAKNGLITLTGTSTLNLMTFASVVITGYDSTTGISTSATLATTTQIGTLSDMNLGSALTNADNKVLTAGDDTTVFYLPYTALDVSGNPTSNFKLVENGLILTTLNGVADSFTTSSPYVKAKLVTDPSNSEKAVIEVRATTDAIQLDMPVVITAMTWSGKTSQLNLTLKKQAAVDTFTLNTPAYDIASNESKIIPFTALDQNGVAITKYDELNGIVTLTGAYFYKNVDGTASVKNNPVSNTGTTTIPSVITAVTSTGKFSSLTLNIQKPVLADTLAIDSSVLMSNMQQATALGNGAIQTIDFGYDCGGLTVKDQYGRDVDMTSTSTTSTKYKVLAESNDNNIVKVVAGNTYATAGQNEIKIQAVGIGSTTIKFTLQDITDAAHPVTIDTKTQTMSVLKNADIKGYTMDAVTKALYTTNEANNIAGNGTLTSKESGYDANPYVYGTTSTGAKVILSGTPIIGVTVSSTDFSVKDNASVAIAYDKISVVANKLTDATKTGSSTTLTVTILGADGTVQSVTTPITSSTITPAATALTAYVDTSVAGVSVSDDIITLDTTASAIVLADTGLTNGGFLAEYKADGSKSKQVIYFAPLDQYGKTASDLSQIVLVSRVETDTIIATGVTTTVTPADLTALTIGTNGLITDAAGYLGTLGTAAGVNKSVTLTISGVTNTGLVKTIQIVIK